MINPPLKTPQDCSRTGPMMDAARVCGDIARCYANFLGTYGHLPSHCFLGPREWDLLTFWIGKVAHFQELEGATYAGSLEFRGMKVFRTDREGILCAIVTVEPPNDNEKPTFVDPKVEGFMFKEDNKEKPPKPEGKDGCGEHPGV
jgi:hypothetical protein